MILQRKFIPAILVAILFVSLGLILYEQRSVPDNVDSRISPDEFSPMGAPVTVEKAQSQLNFTIATIHDFSILPSGTQLIGAYVDPPERTVRGVSLVYWHEQVRVGVTRCSRLLREGRIPAPRGTNASQRPQDALDKLMATLPSDSNGTRLPTPWMQVVTVDGYPYLQNPVGLTWWKSSILFTLILSTSHAPGTTAQYLRDTLTTADMVSIARSVY